MLLDFTGGPKIIWLEMQSKGEGGAFLLSPEAVADKDGSIRLAHSVLIVDEMGATIFVRPRLSANTSTPRKCSGSTAVRSRRRSLYFRRGEEDRRER